MGDGVNFSFNKGQKFDITKSDGVSRDELIRRAGGADSQQGKLLASIFGKYDNGDGILTSEEYKALQADLVAFAKDDNLGGRELRRFNSNLSTNTSTVDGNAYSMEDLQAVIGMMVDGRDDVTTDAQGNILVKTSEEGGGTKTETYQPGENNTLTLLSDEVVNGDTKTFTEYLDGARDKYRSIKVTNGNSTTTTTYASDGTTITSKTRVAGAVTEEFDPANPDRVTKKTTDRGSGVAETVAYTYGPDGSKTEVYTDTAHGDKPVKKVVIDSSGNVTTTTFEYDQENNVTETTTVAGQEPTVVKKDAQGNVIPDTPPTITYDVKSGEAWYNIVAAKYDVSDHKTIMNIVHQLKGSNNVSYSERSMPSQITLPNEVTVGEQKFTLTADAATNPDLIRKEIPTPPTPAAEEVVAVDPHPPVERTTPPGPSAPIRPTVPPMFDFSGVGQRLQNTRALPSQIGQTVTNPDGTKIRYNSDGKISCEYDAQGRVKYNVYSIFYVESEYGVFSGDNPTREIKRNFDGSVRSYTDYEYDFAGNRTRTVERGAQGNVTEYTDYLYDAQGQCYREVIRDAQGNVGYYYDNEYNSAGEETRWVKRNPDGTIDYYWNEDDDKGRNPDGTLQE